MICPACSQSIPDGSNYCPSCAADLLKYRKQIIAQQQEQLQRTQPMRPLQQEQMQRTQPMRPLQQEQMQRTQPMRPLQQEQMQRTQPMRPLQQEQMQRTQPMRPLQQQEAAGYPPPGGQYRYAPEGGGGIFEGISARGKLFFGIGGLVLLVVLVLLIINLFGGGGEDPLSGGYVPPTLPTVMPAVTPTPNPLDLQPTTQLVDLYVTPTPAPTPAIIIDDETVLKMGATGELVIQLQERLQLLGYYSGPVDGDYGGDTIAAVRRFQEAAGLSTDGAAGPETRTRLFNYPIAEPETGTDPNWNVQDGMPAQPDTIDEGPVNQPG